jgi:DNA-binding GntR family transcriptional regulator
MSTVDRVHEEMVGLMLRGELRPGAQLRQDELAHRLGVSKIPVREALQRLTALGLLRFEPNRGAFVPRLSAADAEENFTLRRAIEPRLLERAIPAISIVDLAEAELATRTSDLPLAEANWNFHRALYRPSNWRRGMAIAETLHVAVAPYVVLYTEGLGASDHSHDEHREILDACRNGDVERAVGVLCGHLDSAERSLVEYLAEGGDEPAR